MDVARVIGSIALFVVLALVFRYIMRQPGESEFNRKRAWILLGGLIGGGFFGVQLAIQGRPLLGAIVGIVIPGGIAWELFFGRWRARG